MGKKPERQSNLELLRILLMLLITATHMIGYGGLLSVPGTPPLGRALMVFLSSAGKVGVNGFVMLSGYFMCTSKAGLQPKRLLKFWLQIFFYSAGLFLGLYAAGLCRMRPADALYFFLPVTQNVYWFVSVFFLLMLAAPFLNRLLQGLDRKNYRILLLTFFVMFSVVPTLLRPKQEVPRALWFFFLYLLAGYIRLHPEPLFERKWPALAVSVGCYLACLGYNAAYARLLPQFPALRYLPALWHAPGTSVPLLLCSLGLFLFFKNLKVKGSRLVNVIVSGTFGVYLLHEHGPRMRSLLWLELFDCRPYAANPASLVMHVLLAVAAVFAAGVAIDLIRQYALEKPLFKLLDKTNFGKKYLHD